jgi:hypothetical protein
VLILIITSSKGVIVCVFSCQSNVSSVSIGRMQIIICLVPVFTFHGSAVRSCNLAAFWIGMVVSPSCFK